jgi:hypothetical protein
MATAHNAAIMNDETEMRRGKVFTLFYYREISRRSTGQI